MSIDDGLILDSTAILYIPVQAYDQYGNKYDVLTSGDVAAANLKITINGKNASDFNLNAKWYENVGEKSPIVPAPDATNKIGAIGLSWDAAGSTTAPSSGEILNINFTSNRDDFMAKSYQVPVNSAARASRIELGSHVQAALPGAKVSNTVKLFDQYGAEVTAVPSKQMIYFEVRDKNNKKIEKSDLDFSIPSSISPDTKLPADIDITISSKLQNTNKEYTILAYLGPDDSDPGYDDNKPPVGGSYKLLVDSADNLLEKIEISDTAIKSPIPSNARAAGQEISLDSHYVNLADSGSQLTFDCEMYTRYQGEDIKVAWKNSSSKPVFASNNLIWEVTAPDEVTVNVAPSATNIFTFKEASSSSSPIDDVATVSLTYMSDSKTLSAKERSIKISNKPAMPQGEYQIIKDGEDQDPIVNYLDKNSIAEISAQTAFKLVTEDQYGDTYEDTSLFTVISSKGLFRINSPLTFPTASGSFSIAPVTNTPGDVDTIKVYVTRDDFYEFTVKYIVAPTTP